MQIRFLPGLILFAASYFPLGLILLLQDINEASWGRPLCWNLADATCEFPHLINPARTIGFALICFVSLLVFLWLLNRLPARTEIVVVDAKSVPNDLINYVFPYVVSFKWALTSVIAASSMA